MVCAGCDSTSQDPTNGQQTPTNGVSIDVWMALTSNSPDEFKRAVEEIDANWNDGFIAPVLEVLGFHRPGWRSVRLRKLLSERTGKAVQTDLDEWFRESVWAKPYTPIEQYPVFKAKLYSKVDARFAHYFDEADDSTIRLDEIRWGGVLRDGIPPLKDPEMALASDVEASYLASDDVVFGVFIDGHAKCYPKRVLAWHEMVKDTVGNTSICGVYCTLCGSMIVYRTDVDGIHHELGTSGFLYRSNKLMYDHATESLWSTLRGTPVVGPLVSLESGSKQLDTANTIQLKREAVVTTTWGKWCEQHPETLVLTLNTGVKRDYGEGVAYQDYFSTDDLMFAVPGEDKRLLNKDEVVALRFPSQGDATLAISSSFLAENRVYHGSLAGQSFVVLTDSAGASRVFRTDSEKFVSCDALQAVTANGMTWDVTEEALINGDVSLERLPSHRAFWFGWHAAFPDTELVR